MIDLSFLTEAEQDAILKVLQRDAELKKVEEDRIRHLQDAADDNELKYKSGQWFYEAKSKRHSDKIHGADLVRASIRKRKKPATIELAGVLEEPEEVIEDLKPAKVEKNQSARKVSFLAPDKDKRTLMNGSASPIKPRKNPFNAENAGLDVTDIGDVEHTLENGLELPKPDKMSSKVKFGVKLPYADLNGGSPISLKKTGASLKPAGEPPVPKPRTLLKNDQALDRSSSQAKREDSVNGTGRPRGILKRYSSSSSTDSENVRLAHPIESCRIAFPGSPILEVQKESTVADANGSPDSVDRFKHVRFSSKVLQKTPPQSPEPFGGNEMNEFRILDQGLSNTQLDPSATDGLPSRNPKAVGLDVPQVNPSVTTSTLSSTSLGSDVDVLELTLSEKPSLDKNLTLQTNMATGPEHIYAIVKKQPKIPSTVEIPEYMTPSSREPRFIGQEGTPLEFGKSYGGGGKTNYVPSYPVPSPEHLDVLSEEQPQYYSHKKPGDDKEGLNPQSGNFKVLPIKDRIKTGEVMSNPSEYQNLKSYWNFDGRSPLVQESKPSPGKLHDTILYRSWQTKDLDHKDSKEPSENNLLPNSFDLSEEEQSSHKVATWLAQSSNLYEPLYSEDPGNANEETEDVSSIPKEEEHCPEDLYEKPVVNSVMLESNPPKMDIHEEPPRQVGFIGFEQMENLENQHVAEVIERTAVAKSDNQEFISALQKLEIEASQTEETHEPSVSDASSTQSEEAPSIVEEEITKDTVDTEKNSPDFYNRLLALEEEYKRDPDPEEPEEFATNDIKVSQFPNKEVLISKKVYSSTEFAQPDGILSTDHKKSRSSNMDKERSPLDNYLKSAAKYQTKSPGIYEKNEMGNGLNYKPEIDIPDVPNPNAVILKKAGSINPILSALKRSEAKAISKPLLDVTPTIPNEDEADKLKEQLEGEIPIDTDLKESQFKNPEKLKQLSKSVPAFLHDETDGKDTDSASESSFPIGKHKKSPSSLTDLSGSSGMASMSSVSGSVMSVYSGDFGNVDVKGTIQFAVDYVDQLKEFHVFVSQCKDLAVGDVKKQRSDPYVKSYLYPEKSKMGKRKTAVKKKTLNPAYNEILRYKISKDTLLTQSLNLSVWHNDALGRNSFLGEVELPLDQWDWNNKQMNWYPLQPRTPAAGVGLENRGEIKLSLKYVPQSESGGKSSQTGEVHIWIKDCNQLPQLRGNKINSFVKCTILPDTSRKSRQKTRTVDKTPNPVFNHTMVYDGFKEEDLKEACVELTVWDHNKLTNHFLGGLRIGLGTGKSYGTAVDWMDSSTEESSMWEKMIKDSNIWIDGVLPLRMLKMAKITK